MKIITKSYKVYDYSELSEKAKEKVKTEFLQDEIRNDLFYEDCLETLHYMFPNSNLKVQYSLGYCQGDGLNIYGELKVSDLINLMNNINKIPINLLNKIKSQILPKQEMDLILEYNQYCNDIKIPMNNRYCYSIADNIDFAEEWKDDLEYGEINYNKQIIDKFDLFIRNFFSEFNSLLEKDGYEYFYNISDEEMEETCEANEWTFLEDGTIFY